jgi:hypothetical protein
MKKFWKRSKSRVRGDRRSSAGSLQSPTTPYRASIDAATKPPVPERSAKRIVSPVATPVNGSTHRIQPMLIGISRPSVLDSRPGTAGSIQDAINEAADKVAQSGLGGGQTQAQPQNETPNKIQTHSRTKSPRYVDIFSIKRSQPSPATYNEDVAERNIDVKKVAEDSIEYRYVAKSRYQEEVATRNAHGYSASAGTIDLDKPPAREELPRSPSAMGPAHTIPPDRIADSDDIRRLHHAQLAALNQPKPYARPNSSKRNDRVSFDDELLISSASLGPDSPNGTGTARLSSDEPEQPVRKSRDFIISHPVAQQCRDRQTPVTENGLATQPTVSPNSHGRASSLPGYKVSQSEVLKTENEQPHRKIDRPKMSIDLDERSMSLRNTSSSVRKVINLQYRTIMDLTGDDDEIFKSGGAASDMTNTPVVEIAQADLYRRINPELISTLGRLGRRDGDETVLPQAGMGKENTPNTSNLATKPVTPVLQQLSTFSTISTITSISPTSQINSKPPPDVTNLSPTKIGSRGLPSRLSTVEEGEPEIEGSRTPVEESQRLAGTPVPKAPEETIEPNASATLSAPPPSIRSSVESPPISRSADSPSNGMQKSPGNLQSRDYVEPSHAFGVAARDFAITPTKAGQHSYRPEREPNTSAKMTQHKPTVTKRETSHSIESSIPNSSPSSSSDFDEAKFRLKQEQARAALVKLQQSLNEDFVPPQLARPTKETAVRNRTTSGSSNTSNDGKPIVGGTNVRKATITGSQLNGVIQPRTSSQKKHVYSTYDQPSSSNRALKSSSTGAVKQSRRQQSPPIQSKRTDREIDSALDGMRRLAEEMRNPRLAPPVQPLPPKLVNVNRHSNSTNSTSESDILPSPGEISLSSFPQPSSVQHSRNTSLNLPIQSPLEASPPGTKRNSLQFASVPVIQSLDETTEFLHQDPHLPAVASSLKSHVSELQQQPPHQKIPSSSSTFSPPQVNQAMAERRMTSRRNSMQSQTSALTNSSQFSIPFHLIPERGSSMRDSLVREVDDED